MKGLVFNEFLEMVEEKFGFEISNQIVINSNLDTKGIYSSLGYYDYKELVSMVVQLHKITKIEIPLLIKTFGTYLFSIFVKNYGIFFQNEDNLLRFLSKIEDIIHVEVLKLYPDAEFPKFKIELLDEQQIHFLYNSSKGLHDLAEGLILGAAIHFNTKVEIEKEFVQIDGTCVLFKVKVV